MRHNVISRPNVYIQLGAVVRKPSIHSDRVVRDLFKYKNIIFDYDLRLCTRCL